MGLFYIEQSNGENGRSLKALVETNRWPNFIGEHLDSRRQRQRPLLISRDPISSEEKSLVHWPCVLAAAPIASANCGAIGAVLYWAMRRALTTV